VQFLIVLAILLSVALFVTTPLRRVRSAEESADETLATAHETVVEELEAAREAKYREIRDAELDHQTGKLSDEDYALLDRSLRGEAVEILRQLDRAATIEAR
jgi:vacuolar-type H+-ATPase subunit H